MYQFEVAEEGSEVNKKVIEIVGKLADIVADEQYSVQELSAALLTVLVTTYIGAGASKQGLLEYVDSTWSHINDHLKGKAVDVQSNGGSVDN